MYRRRQSLTSIEMDLILRDIGTQLREGGPPVDRDAIILWDQKRLPEDQDEIISSWIGTYRAWNEAYTEVVMGSPSPKTAWRQYTTLVRARPCGDALLLSGALPDAWGSPLPMVSITCYPRLKLTVVELKDVPLTTERVEAYWVLHDGTERLPTDEEDPAKSVFRFVLGLAPGDALHLTLHHGSVHDTVWFTVPAESVPNARKRTESQNK